MFTAALFIIAQTLEIPPPKVFINRKIRNCSIFIQQNTEHQWERQMTHTYNSVYKLY